MAILNITYQGLSADVTAELDFRLSDDDIRRIALEVVRTGGVPGLHFPNVPDEAFRHYIVDRFTPPAGTQRIYLRPKVPFGAIR